MLLLDRGREVEALGPVGVGDRRRACRTPVTFRNAAITAYNTTGDCDASPRLVRARARARPRTPDSSTSATSCSRAPARPRRSGSRLLDQERAEVLAARRPHRRVLPLAGSLRSGGGGAGAHGVAPLRAVGGRRRPHDRGVGRGHARPLRCRAVRRRPRGGGRASRAVRSRSPESRRGTASADRYPRTARSTGDDP